LKANIITYRKDFEDEWLLIKNTLGNYTEFFPGLGDPEMYDKIY
jgi:hypothetical protein